jgi:hypothetical protein
MSLVVSPVGSMGVQIERSTFTGQANQQWNIIRDSTTGAVHISSVHIHKCWNNGGTIVGGPLTHSTCSLVSTDNKNFYLDPQGFVTNCGGSEPQVVRTSSPAMQQSPHCFPEHLYPLKASGTVPTCTIPYISSNSQHRD